MASHANTKDWPGGQVVLSNVAVPTDLVGAPERFGGTADGDLLRGDLLVSDGKAEALLAPGTAPSDVSSVDCGGAIVLPGLVEAHCHLDKCHTGHRLRFPGGDLLAAIEAQNADKANWTAADLRTRTGRGLAELRAAGCRAVRTHVDWPHDPAESRTPPPAWAVMGDLAEELAGQIELQRAALVSLDLYGDEAAGEALARRVAQDGGVLGAFVLHHADRQARLERVFDLAERFGLPLDFHVDEGLDPGLDGLETIAAIVAERGYQGPVACGHALSLATMDGDRLRRSLDLIARANLSIISLPATNLYLQDRRQGTPMARGITRLGELRSAGICVAVGSDNVCDAFCPVGRHDPLHALSLAALSAHLDAPHGPWLRSVTTDAARAISIEPIPVDRARMSDLLISNASSTSEFVAGLPGPPVGLSDWLDGRAMPSAR